MRPLRVADEAECGHDLFPPSKTHEWRKQKEARAVPTPRTVACLGLVLVRYTARSVAEHPLARHRSGSGTGGSRVARNRASRQLLVGVRARAVALARQRLRVPARPRLLPDPEGV